MKEMTLLSEKDDLPLSMLVKEPEEEAKGIIQIAHGMAEHKERYQEFMEYVAIKGYIAIIHDHRGHGKSVRKQEDLGYFYDHTATYIVEDVHQITKWAKEQYPALPITLLGHSMGAMVVRKYCQTYDAEIDKLIVCGSPSKNAMAKQACRIAKIMGMLKGGYSRSDFLQKQTFKNVSRSKKTKDTSNAWLCSNKEVVEAYNQDPLCGFPFTINGFENVYRLNTEIYEKKNWNVSHPKMPILFIAGSDDPVIISKQAWEESQTFLRKIGYTNVSGKLYTGGRHEILNETNKQEVYEDIVNWIEREI